MSKNKVKEYVVVALAVSGRGNKIHRAGARVTAEHFPEGNAIKLVKSGHIRPTDLEEMKEFNSEVHEDAAKEKAELKAWAEELGMPENSTREQLEKEEARQKQEASEVEAEARKKAQEEAKIQAEENARKFKELMKEFRKQFRKKDFKGAEETLKKALVFNPEDAEANGALNQIQELNK